MLYTDQTKCKYRGKNHRYMWMFVINITLTDGLTPSRDIIKHDHIITYTHISTKRDVFAQNNDKYM